MMMMRANSKYSTAWTIYNSNALFQLCNMLSWFIFAEQRRRQQQQIRTVHLQRNYDSTCSTKYFKLLWLWKDIFGPFIKWKCLVVKYNNRILSLVWKYFCTELMARIDHSEDYSHSSREKIAALSVITLDHCELGWKIDHQHYTAKMKSVCHSLLW